MTVDERQRSPLEEPDWHNRRAVVLAAGVAAVLLVALLVFAVIQVSRTTTQLPGPTGDLPSVSAPSKTVATSSRTSTSYTVPSVSTSQSVPPPPPAPTVESTPDEETDPTSTTLTTIFNPYATTTTPGSAGHI